MSRVAMDDTDFSSHHTSTLIHKVCLQGLWFKLRVPLSIPYTGNLRELASRLINAHRLPAYLEGELCQALEQFVQQETLQYLDQQAEENYYGGSVLEEGSETDQTVEQWVSCFTENNVEFAPVVESRGLENVDLTFPEVYHKLIHSPALETLLQLEHTYALAVLEMCKARDNAMEIIQRRHDSELAEAMSNLGAGRTEADINTMMRGHTLERERGEGVWSSELSQLQESQRREYREWVLKLAEESPDKVKGLPSAGSVLSMEDRGFEAEDQPLEESFTIHLGTQQKTMHNIRLLCGDPLDLCRHKAGHTHSPERLLTAMSLYSGKLSGLVTMVDGRISSLGGIKEAFAKVCHQSTDFHFQDIDVQLSHIQECALIGNNCRQEHRLTESMSSHTSDALSPDRNDMTAQYTSRICNHLNLYYTCVGSLGPVKEIVSSGQSPEPGHNQPVEQQQSSSLLDTTSVSLEPGDFYMTRHSNLSNVHLVFHLVTEESAIQSSALKSRHPVIIGLKNCLRAAARHDVHHVTIPLLLVHTMLPDMTIPWCLKRAELIFKCVKGFMLESTSWGDGDSRTIQFLVPKGISKDLFHEFCDMLPKVFRVTSTRNLTSRTGYK